MKGEFEANQNSEKNAAQDESIDTIKKDVSEIKGDVKTILREVSR